jgi:hypothetical protein
MVVSLETSRCDPRKSAWMNVIVQTEGEMVLDRPTAVKLFTNHA